MNELVMAPTSPLLAVPEGAERANAVAVAFLEGYRSPCTVEAYSRDVRHWFDWLDFYGAEPLSAHRFHVDRWINELIEAELSPATIARMVSAVRNYYGWAVDQGVLTRSPFPADGRRLHLPKVSTKSQTLGPDRAEARELYAAARTRGARDNALLSILLHQGLRASEVCSLDREDYGSERGHRTLLVHRKGGEDQRMAVAPVAVAALDAYLAARRDVEAPLFLAGERAATYPRMTRQQITDVITGCCVEAGLYELYVDRGGRERKRPKFSPHSFRHTCATQLLDEGVPLRDVQVFLGHASPLTTQRYDLGRDQLDRSPAYTLSGLFG